MLLECLLYITDETYRSISINTGVPKSSLQKTALSSSNPQLNASSEETGLNMLSGRMPSLQGDQDRDVQGELRNKSEFSNLAGNRSSMAESRERAINVPGLMRPNSNRKVREVHPVAGLPINLFLGILVLVKTSVGLRW